MSMYILMVLRGSSSMFMTFECFARSYGEACAIAESQGFTPVSLA